MDPIFLFYMDPKDKDPKELYDPLPSTGNLFVILILSACPAYEESVFLSF